MNKREITERIEKAKELGIPLRGETQKALAELENPHYTITLSGRFQVGKSTLLNKVMLGSDVLLSEGIGLPTTAIPSKIVYAPVKELTVVYRDEGKQPDHYYGEAVTPELIRSLTTAKGEDARLALSEKIRHVVLGMPVEALRTYTFFDTPGVEDPNKVLIERTTAETLPQSDVVILVVDASRQLSEDDLDYLKRAVFTEGMTRVMVLASYKPQVYVAPEARTAIINTIRAQLKQIGRDYVPVVSYTYDPEVEGDILHGPEEILGAVLKFLAENCEGAKIDKLAWLLSSDAVAYAESLKAKIEVSGKSADELEELKRRIEAVARNLDAQYNQTVCDFSVKFSVIQSETSTSLRSALLGKENEKSVLNGFIKQLNDVSDLNSLKQKVESAVLMAGSEVQSHMAEAGSLFAKQMREALQSVSEQADAAASSIALSPEFKPIVSGGWAGKVSPAIIKAIEVVAAGLLGGPIYGVVAYFLDKIPVLGKAMPHTMLVSMAKRSFITSFENELAVSFQGFLGQMENAESSVKDGIRELFASIYAERIEPYEKAAKEQSGNLLSAEDAKTIRAQIAKTESFVATVQI